MDEGALFWIRMYFSRVSLSFSWFSSLLNRKNFPSSRRFLLGRMRGALEIRHACTLYSMLLPLFKKKSPVAEYRKYHINLELTLVYAKFPFQLFFCFERIKGIAFPPSRFLSLLPSQDCIQLWFYGWLPWLLTFANLFWGLFIFIPRRRRRCRWYEFFICTIQVVVSLFFSFSVLPSLMITCRYWNSFNEERENYNRWFIVGSFLKKKRS